MDRPYVICHMVISLDGKVTGEFLSQEAATLGIEEYYKINRESSAQAFACGRITMEGSFTNKDKVNLSDFENCKVDKKDFIAFNNEKKYAISFDRKGKLGWKNSHIIDEDPGYNAHIIQVMCEDVSDAYLAYLQSIKVSYILAGKGEMDLPLALYKLKQYFGINKILLEGGSIINTAFEKEGLIDELSLIEVPLFAKKEDLPLFDKSVARDYVLVEDKKINADGTAFKRYVLK